MDRARIIADDVVDRYVARRLSAEEEAQFEAYLVRIRNSLTRSISRTR
jgi:hypothetical protein